MLLRFAVAHFRLGLDLGDLQGTREGERFGLLDSNTFPVPRLFQFIPSHSRERLIAEGIP